MSARNKAPGPISEMLLWGATSVAMIAAVVALLLAWGRHGDWHAPATVAATTVGALVSLTWGAWASLVWARQPVVRRLLELNVLMPGVLIIGLGAVLMYFGWGGWIAWLALLGPALGSMATAMIMTRQGQMQAQASAPYSYLAAFVLFPLLTLPAAGLIAWLWLGFVGRPSGCGLRHLLNLSTLMVSALGLSLVTTVIPSAASRACREIAARWSGATRP